MLFFLILQPILVNSQWFSGDEKQQTTTNIETEDASKPFPATTSVECILECHRKLREGYFVERKGQCFCLESEDQKIYSNDDINNGIFYEAEEKLPLRSCAEIKEKCPHCVPGFYSLESSNEQYNVFCNLTAHGVSYPTCRGVKDYCPTFGTGFYNFESTDGGGVRVFCMLTTNGAVSDGSCKAIKEFRSGLPSGFYMFEIFGQLTEVYCDMVVKGGGWLAIGNVTLEKESEVRTMFEHIKPGYQISQLQNIRNGYFMLSTPEVKELFTNGGYTEVRVNCFKPSHGRTLHIILKGDKVVKWMRRESKSESPCDEEIQYLTNDTSKMANEPCGNIRIGGNRRSLWYDHLLWVPGRTHILFMDTTEKTRVECDDFYKQENYHEPGYWFYFVR